MKLEETENLKLHYANDVQTTSSQNNNTQDLDNELAEKICQILNMDEKNPIFKGKASCKNIKPNI